MTRYFVLYNQEQENMSKDINFCHSREFCPTHLIKLSN